MTKTASSVQVVSGLVGGLVAVVIGAILIATGVIDTGSTKTIVRQSASSSRPAADPSGPAGQTVHQIYQRVGPGVAFIQAKVRSGTTSIFGGSQQGTATGSGFALD